MKYILPIILLSLTGCNQVKSVLRSTHDVAKDLCTLYHAEKQGIDLKKAAKDICENEEKLRPWLDHVLSLKKNGVTR